MAETRTKKWERRRDGQAAFSEALSEARVRTVQSDTDAERIEALRWAHENGVHKPWMDASLRKLQRDRAVRSSGFDPERGVRVSESETGGSLLWFDPDVEEVQTRARTSPKKKAKAWDDGERSLRPLQGREICKRQHGSLAEQKACNERNEAIRAAERAEREAERARQLRERRNRARRAARQDRKGA